MTNRFASGCAWIAASISLALGLGPSAARADVLLTEVIPNVTTTATAGDVVEIYNTGPGPVDLTDWVLTDLDNDPVGGVLQDATFAPGFLAIDPLEAGEFAVVEFVDIAGTASWVSTNYGLRIVAPLVAGSFLGSERDELLLADAAHTPVDLVAWADTGTVVTTDSYEDLSAVTGVIFDYGLTPGTAAWSGAETIASDADYYAAAVDFTAFAAVTTYGGGAIRRRSTGGVFDVASPDGATQWEAIPRHQASLGNASDDVPSGPGLQPIRVTDDLATWLGQIETSFVPHRRIAAQSDQNPPDFVASSPAEDADWQAVIALAMSGAWEQAFAAADLLGYEVVEFLDLVSGETFHLLRERFVPGEGGFTGRGVYAFFEGSGVRDDLVLEVPHPIFDDETLEEGATGLVSVRPRVLLIAGTHRNNHLTETTCDGSFSGGAKYRISDVAHHPDNFFHATHKWLDANVADLRVLQLHGFCCPGVAPYDLLTDDCVVSNGIDAVPGSSDFTQILRTSIDDQNHLAGGADLTTAVVYGDDADVLGATTNLQGRFSNGVAEDDECLNAAVSASGRFFHLEQDPDVRDDYQHILDAIAGAVDEANAFVSPCEAVPAAGCREAGPGKSKVKMDDKDGGDKDKLLWKWTRGQESLLADFSDAVSGSALYQLCVYDDSLAPQPVLDAGVVAGGVCDDKPCWKEGGTKGYSYRSKTGQSGGITALKLTSGVAGRAKVLVKAKGASLVLPALPLTSPVVVQLLIDDGLTTECWQTTYTAPFKKNEVDRFLAKQ